MQIRTRFSTNRTPLRAIASIGLAALVLAGSFARADDPAPAGQQTTVKRQDASATDSDKDAKSISDAAKKVDLSSALSNLNFHGSATVGYVSTFGKTAWGGKNSQSGMYSAFQIGTDFKLSKDTTLTVQFGVARYPNNFLLFR